MSSTHPNTPRPRRSRIVTVRFIPDEYEDLMEAAREHSLSASTMLRGALGYARIPPPKTDAATAAQLGRIGGNLWQLIGLIRMGKSTHDEAVIEELRKAVLNINERLLDVSLADVGRDEEASE